MAKEVFKSGTTLLGFVDLSADINEFSFDPEASEVEITNLTSAGWKEFLASLPKAAASFQGFREMAEPDNSLFAALDGGLSVPVAASKTYPLVNGDVMYGFRSIETKYQPNFKVADAERMSLYLCGDSPMARGIALDTASITGNGNSAGINHGAVSATQSIYAGLFVTAWNATSLDLILQSDDAVGFPSPTSRITFDQVTALTAAGKAYQWKKLGPGAITDTWWRINRTLVGTSATYTVFFAIL